MPNHTLPPGARPIWTPADTAAIAALADEYPSEVGESQMLADIVDQAVGR